MNAGDDAAQTFLNEWVQNNKRERAKQERSARGIYLTRRRGKSARRSFTLFPNEVSNKDFARRTRKRHQRPHDVQRARQRTNFVTITNNAELLRLPTTAAAANNSNGPQRLCREERTATRGCSVRALTIVSVELVCSTRSGENVRGCSFSLTAW